MKIAAIIAAGLVAALGILFNVFAPFAFLFIFMYLWLLFRYPEIALFISIAAIFNFYSMVNEDFLRVPNVFRIRDVFFLLAFLPLLVGVYKKNPMVAHVFNNPVAKGIYIILCLSLLQALVTKMRFPDETLNSIIRMGRKYFYYTLFFPLLYVMLYRPGSFRRFVGLFALTGAALSAAYIAQFMLGPANSVFLSGRVEYQSLQGANVTRIYIMGTTIVTLLFHISLMVLLFCKDSRQRAIGAFLTVLSGIETLLTFGRAHILGVAGGTILGIGLAGGRNRTLTLLKVVIVIVLILVAVEGVGRIFFAEKEFLFSAVSSRVTSVYSAMTRDSEDTFFFRIRESMKRQDLISRNLLFGIGFVHDESRLFASERGYDTAIRTADSGLVSLVLDFGVSGVIWLGIFTSIVLRRFFQLYRVAQSPFYKSVMLGILSFYLGRLLSFLTLADFVSYDGITIVVLSLAIMEAIGRTVQRSEAVIV